MTLILPQPLTESHTVIVAVPALTPWIVTVLPFNEAVATAGLVLPGIDRVPATFDAVMLRFWSVVTVAVVCERTILAGAELERLGQARLAEWMPFTET